MMKRILTSVLLLLVIVPLMAQNPDFDRKYEAAKSLYNQGQFEKARTAINNTLKNLPSLSAEQIKKGNQLKSQCDQAIANRDRLDLAVNQIMLPFGSGLDSISFVAAKPDIVKASSSAPSWCQVEKVMNGYVYLNTQMNPDKKPRIANITVTMGRVKRSLVVTQEARPETIKPVRISTKPQNGSLIVDKGTSIVGAWEGKLGAGRHNIHVEKNGYAPKDTVITIADDMKDDQLEFVIPLVPTFGRVKVEVLPEEGFSFKEDHPYEIRINSRLVENLNYSYDDDRDIEERLQYADGTIPVKPGPISIHATADSFVEGIMIVDVNAGELVTVPIFLKARFGRLSLVDVGQASDAEVYVDGKPLGTVKDIVYRPLSIGNHILTLERPGFVSQENSYPFTLTDNQDIEINVAMFRYVPYVFDSTPPDARVFINGEFVGFTPTKPYLLKEIEPSQAYELEIVKDGYSRHKETISPDYLNNEPVLISKDLVVSHKLTVAGDESNLLLFVKNEKKGDSTFVDGVLLPAEIDLPLREKPYYLELKRIGKKRPAFRKHFKFNTPEANQYKFRTWSHNVMAFSGAIYFVGPKIISIGNEEIGFKSYNHTAEARLATIPIVPGLSTSLLRGSLFMGKDKQESLDGSSKITIQNEQFLPAISAAFLNWDFRVGGTFWDYMDLNLLASYAWYPNFLKNIAGFSHISGHDVFIGMEVSSRIMVANITFKAGYQMYPGLTAHLYNSAGTRSVIKENYLEDIPMTIPNMFVVGVELSLGAKGKSIWRPFY